MPLLLLLVVVCVTVACSNRAQRVEAPPDEERAAERARMVAEQVEARGVRDPRVLEALRAVPRHRFVPADAQALAYEDGPLSIGHAQTISQPYVVGLMSEAVDLQPHERVLEVGTGSGDQAAVLAQLARSVDTIEIVEPLARRARATLAELGLTNVTVHVGDGFAGLPERAPFDAIVVTAAPSEVPPPLLEQLAIGGRLVIPVGPAGRGQDLVLYAKRADGTLEQQSLIPVRFVPMTGEAERR
jgi:protein-L-isoaspartate(D-aspartate) O-methyltransferase